MLAYWWWAMFGPELDCSKTLYAYDETDSCYWRAQNGI
jgi:hypothetical protein